MKFKTDENLPVQAATTLREAGFDAETVACRAPKMQPLLVERRAKTEFRSHSIWILLMSRLPAEPARRSCYDCSSRTRQPSLRTRGG